MSTERTIEVHLQSKDSYIDITDTENPTPFIFECNQKLDNGENCGAKIETSGPTASVSLTCDLWTSRSKQGFFEVTCYFITSEFEMKEITLAIQYLKYLHTKEPEEESNLHRIFYKVITDVEIWWSSTYIAWRKDIIKDLLEILGPFAKLTEILEGTKYATMSYIYPGITKLKCMFNSIINSNLDLETNNNMFENHQFEEADEDDEPEAR
ncbi:hypothetical protein RCL_jg21475.t1 [Rhizophagus clarus]|uniref:hAT-like transposase RNase-H fold domain-containing protein n=1 Tax=Rhizophagus clarus TaxID=94130 RepID=A0A8H3L3F6_9GLOM|nr:hypothetical protein RCL_jg21475.t1 [Rhizophagus clarus]